MESHGFLLGVQTSRVYWALLVFFAFYPILSSLVWVTTSLLYFFRREVGEPDPDLYRIDGYPLVSVLIPAHNEEKTITSTLRGVLEMDYPFLEVVVVDDASVDNTVARVSPFVVAGEVRLIRKTRNEGKAMALNDAIPCLNGEIVLIMDADARPDPALLKWMVPHFNAPRVGGVTGNPRVANRGSLLAKLQLIEFASIVSLLRRAQRIWGRLLTMSGVVGAFRRSALIDVGMFSPEMATEDIDITWKLQRRFYDVRFEPRAVVWMQVPSGVAGLLKQRIRWARGLAQVLRRHLGGVALSWRQRRFWPVLVEAILSIGWAYCAVLLTGIWGLSWAAGLPPIGVSPIPNWWGMLIATCCLLQLLTGVLIERRYDRDITPYYGVAVLYPVIYWMLMIVVTFVGTPLGLFGKLRRGSVSRWRTART
jgi:poly-beta-1,6-N-acetyl-D-glucosamine synthase